MKSALVYSMAVAATVLTLVVGVTHSAPSRPEASGPIPRPLAATETFSKSIEDGGTGSHKAILTFDASLPTHTIFRPKDLSAFGGNHPLPIVAWGNGACANSPYEVLNYLSEIASHGFLVVAIGPTPANEPATRRGGRPGGPTTSNQLLDAVDWATAQNANKDSIYFGKIDTKKIAVMGHSCGGLQALEVSPDPRITTTVVADSGILNFASTRPAAATAPARGGGMPGMPPLTKDHLTRLHAPVLYILGGPSDMATPNGTDDFRRIEKIPAFFASINVGHGGTFGRPHGGEFAPVTVAWLNWHLKGDAESAKMFTGVPSGLSKVPGWTVEKKNIP